ncbi:Chromosomal replication initiator protein DnaA, partial [Trichinella spiralis]
HFCQNIEKYASRNCARNVKSIFPGLNRLCCFGC